MQRLCRKVAVPDAVAVDELKRLSYTLVSPKQLHLTTNSHPKSTQKKGIYETKINYTYYI